MFYDALIVWGYITLVERKYKTFIRMAASDIGQPQVVQSREAASLYFQTSPN